MLFAQHPIDRRGGGPSRKLPNRISDTVLNPFRADSFQNTLERIAFRNVRRTFRPAVEYGSYAIRRAPGSPSCGKLSRKLSEPYPGDVLFLFRGKASR